MDVFQLRDSVIGDYQGFIQGFLHIRDKRIRDVVEQTLADGLLWPEPWLSLNPKFTVERHRRGASSTSGLLHPECGRVFRSRQGGRPERDGLSAVALPPPGRGDRGGSGG